MFCMYHCSMGRYLEVLLLMAFMPQGEKSINIHMHTLAVFVRENYNN